jgi:hypothetical protein
MTTTNQRATFIFRWLSLPLMCMMMFLLIACDSTTTTTPIPPPASTGEPTSMSTPATSHGGPVVDQVSLIDALRKAGVTVSPAGKITQPFLSVEGQSLQVNGESVQVYEYPDESAVARDASKIQPDATIAGTSIMWVAQPHFYRAGKLIILYTGTNAALLAALDSAVGKPFAVGANFSGPTIPTTIVPTP